MFLTWTVLRCRTPAAAAPWTPAGASWWQAGGSSPGDAQARASDGTWWSVVATWDDADEARRQPLVSADVEAWHVVLEPRSSHGDVVLPGGALPFDGLPDTTQIEGPVGLVTVAGESADDGREREFFRRFLHASRDIVGAPGHVVSLVHAPVPTAAAGPVLTFSVWTDLASGLDWAYTRSRPHSSAVARQQSHRLVEASGSVRCALLSSSGRLGDLADPLAGLGGLGGLHHDGA